MQQRCDQRQQVARHLLITLRCGMQSIGLHTSCRAVNTLEQEGKQGHMIFPGQQRIGFVELADVIRAVLRRERDTAEDHLGACAFERRDDVVEVLARAVDGQPAQTVIAAEGDNDDGRLQGEHLIQPLDSIFCRVATDARVHHMVVKAFRIQIVFEKIWITVAGLCTVPCSKAVAKGDNDGPSVAGLDTWLRCRSGRGGCRLRRRSRLSFAADGANTQSSGEAELQVEIARVHHTFNLAADRPLDEVASDEGTA
jgi:hypothetical protein